MGSSHRSKVHTPVKEIEVTEESKDSPAADPAVTAEEKPKAAKKKAKKEDDAAPAAEAVVATAA